MSENKEQPFGFDLQMESNTYIFLHFSVRVQYLTG